MITSHDMGPHHVTPRAEHAEDGPLIAPEIITSWVAVFSGGLQALSCATGFGKDGSAERHPGQARARRPRNDF